MINVQKIVGVDLSFFSVEMRFDLRMISFNRSVNFNYSTITSIFALIFTTLVVMVLYQSFFNLNENTLKYYN